MSDRLIHVEIVTPVYNRRETTLQCLRSLKRINQTGLKVHTIIVDDGSKDGTGEAIREQFPEVEVIRGDGTLHYTGGTNRGIEAALEKNPDYVLAINNDSIFDEQFLQRMIKCAEESPRTVVGALLLLWDCPHKVFQIGSHWRTWYGGWQPRLQLTAFDVPQHPFEVEIIVGNCVLYPVAAIREVGLMNAKRFPYGFGDIEYTPRMRRKGWRLLIEPRARVWCEPNTDLPSPSKLPKKKLVKDLFLDYENQYNLFRQFVSRWESAPTRTQAVTAFGIMLVRLGLKAIGIMLVRLGLKATGIGTWPNWPDEKLNGKRS
jgi:GT2 family glycosyltransferase